MSGSEYYDNEFKAILCNQNNIMMALGSMLFGMNMYNKGLEYSYVFESLSGNGRKRYSAAQLFEINNLGVMNKCEGAPGYTQDIDREFICLVQHASVYMSAIVAVRMARQALADGRNYIFSFVIPNRGSKSYDSRAIVSIADEAANLSSCCGTLADDDCITRCLDYFCSV